MMTSVMRFSVDVVRTVASPNLHMRAEQVKMPIGLYALILVWTNFVTGLHHARFD